MTVKNTKDVSRRQKLKNIYIKYAIIEFLGAVAQLGEHCVRIAGVRGSNPLSSTLGDDT